MSKRRSTPPIAKLVVCASALLLSAAWIRNSATNIRDATATAAVANNDAVVHRSLGLGSSSSSSSSRQQHQLSCQKILNDLDDKFDRRRDARQEAAPEKSPKGSKRNFDPYEPEATCVDEERFGSEERYSAFGDGPKFVCGVDVIAEKAKKKKNLSGSNGGSGDGDGGDRSDDADAGGGDGCLVYSVGSNNDVRFEKAVHDFAPGCEVHTFDPTLADEPFVGVEYATFHPWGLGTDGGKEGDTMHGRKNAGDRKSFETIIRELGHEDRTIDVLKIDCQGCEYAAMPPLFDLMAEGKVRVDQVLIELHDRGEPLRDFFESADRAKLRVFHKERNGWGCEGYRCVEYAFVSETFLREANGAAMCPGVDVQIAR